MPKNWATTIFMVLLDGQTDGKKVNFNAFYKIQINFFRPTKFNVHEICISSPSPKLTGFPFIKTLHEPYSSALKNKTRFSKTFHLFQVVGIQLFHFLSLHKPRTYPSSFLVLFQLIKFHQFLVSKCFCIHDILLQTNQHQSFLLLRLVFLHFVSVLFVRLFLFLSFFLASGRVFFLC